MNTIKIPSLYETYIDYCLKCRPNGLKIHSFDDFIFNEFRLATELQQMKLMYEIKMGSHFITIKVEERENGQITGEYAIQWIWQHIGNIADGIGVMLPSYGFEEIFDTEYARRMANAQGKFCIWAMGYIMSQIEDRETEIRHDKTTIIRKYSKEHRISTEKNRIYLLEDVIKYACDKYIANGIHHEISCPCWEVRGHYRHYKSGKVVFIPAFRKGKERDKVQPKEKEYYL